MKWFVPGRLEVLGKHTDYMGGRSLLAAVDRGITATLTPLLESHVSGADPSSFLGSRGPGAERPDRVETSDAPFVVSTTALPGELALRPGVDPALPAGHWGNYVQAALDRLALNFGALRPARIVLDSNLPLASGMSSSSALVVATALALVDDNNLRSHPAWCANIVDDLDLAGYLATIENGLTFKDLEGLRGVGTFGGSEDHTAMLCCAASTLTEFTFCPIVRRREVPFPADLTFVVAVSGVLAEKTGAALEAYNRASLTARALVEAWNDATGSAHAVLADALASDEDALEGLRAVAAHDPALTARLTAFVTETEVAIPRAIEALEAGDLEAFGRAVDLSHRNAAEALGNQIPETNRLQALARELGAHAASGFGAGFGGSVWALVDAADAEAFGARWLDRYVAEFPAVAGAASTLVTRPGGPARRLD
ncbi:MAG: galactokinase family protein [Arachnia sp.]